MIHEIDIEPLRAWFLQEKRIFPWRSDPTPYMVWISEVMLQQTQSARVVDFFTRWMKRFPDIETLAKASEQEVLKYWEGLGYY
ncbi:MAG: mutY [Chlamydiia bacterium]|nr:mutY [Chlamydiia bacterium]